MDFIIYLIAFLLLWPLFALPGMLIGAILEKLNCSKKITTRTAFILGSIIGIVLFICFVPYFL